MSETVDTYNPYTLLGKFDKEENIIIHNVNQPIDVYLTGLKGPISISSKNSLQAFGLRERNRNMVIQIIEKKSIVVIEAIIPGSEVKKTINEAEDCKIQQAIIGQQSYGFNPFETLNLPAKIIFMAAQGCYDKTTMQEHAKTKCKTKWKTNSRLSVEPQIDYQRDKHTK